MSKPILSEEAAVQSVGSTRPCNKHAVQESYIKTLTSGNRGLQTQRGSVEQ